MLYTYIYLRRDVYFGRGNADNAHCYSFCLYSTYCILIKSVTNTLGKSANNKQVKCLQLCANLDTLKVQLKVLYRNEKKLNTKSCIVHVNWVWINAYFHCLLFYFSAREQLKSKGQSKESAKLIRFNF